MSLAVSISSSMQFSSSGRRLTETVRLDRFSRSGSINRDGIALMRLALPWVALRHSSTCRCAGGL